MLFRYFDCYSCSSASTYTKSVSLPTFPVSRFWYTCKLENGKTAHTYQVNIQMVILSEKRQPKVYNPNRRNTLSLYALLTVNLPDLLTDGA